MPNINKPFYALAYSAFGVTLPPLVAIAVEIVSGYEHSPTTWKVVWLISIVSLFVMAMSFLYIIIYVIPIEKLIFKAISPIMNLFGYKQANVESPVMELSVSDAPVSLEQHESEPQTEEQIQTLATVSTVDGTVSNDVSGEIVPLDERHRQFLPYVKRDENDNPVAPVLDIFDEVFKNNKEKKQVGIALYCAYSLKWITDYPAYKEMNDIFGSDIVGSPGNYSTYMRQVRDVTDDYDSAENDFLKDVRAMKQRLKETAQRFK